jgi:DNA-directed RNA polymerase beta' subunit
MSDEILKGIGDSAPADATATPEEPAADATAATPEGGAETAEEPAAEEPAADTTAAPEAPAEEADPKKEFQEAVGKLGQTINDLQDKKQFDEKDIKNAMNSLITAIGPEGFKLVGDKVVESFYKKMQGSEVSTDDTEEEAPVEEPSAEEEAPAEEPKLDENFVRGLKVKAKVLLKEQLQQEIEKRKRNILIESIKRKII